jgi:hypothetical protein
MTKKEALQELFEEIEGHYDFDDNDAPIWEALEAGWDACLNRVCKCGMRGDGVYCLRCGGKIEEES